MDYFLSSPELLKSFLKGLRTRSGLTQKALAGKLGVTQQAYQKIESNPESVSFERIMQIFKLIGVEVFVRDANLNSPKRDEALTRELSRSSPAKVIGKKMKFYSTSSKPDRRASKDDVCTNRKKSSVILVKATGNKASW